MNVHLIDGTYELFRQHFGQAGRHADESPHAATIGVLSSTLQMLSQGATHIGVASDHVVESFRNGLYTGYKTSEGVDPLLLSQFIVLEEALGAMGVKVWPMVEFEADDALASGAALASRDARVDRVIICTPDKDLAQCVRGARVVQFDRRKRTMRDEAGVIEKFGVPPASIPDYLALVGDAADGFPGLPGWGAKSAAVVLARYGSIEAIPARASAWDLSVRSAPILATTLRDHLSEALLYRTLARLRADAPIPQATPAELRWNGTPRVAWQAFCAEFGLDGLRARPHRWSPAA